MRVPATLWALAMAASCMAAVLTTSASAFGQAPAAALSSSEVAWRADFLKRRGYFTFYAADRKRVTAIAGPKLDFIPAEDSRRELCLLLLNAHKAQRATITSARIVDPQGQVLLECAS